MKKHVGKLNLEKFKKQVTIRLLVPSDFESVVALQTICFPGMEPWSRAQFESQISVFPEGQIGIVYQDRLVGSSSSVVLDFAIYNDWQSWDEISDNGFIRNHNPQGNTLYGIEMMVDPSARGRKLARRLYDARKLLAREMNLMRVVIGGRIPGYHKHAHEMSAREYIDRVMSRNLMDPVLSKQIANGFVLKRLIPNYLPEDAESMGHATFLEWTNIDYVPPSKGAFIWVAPVRVCVVQYQMRQIRSFEDFSHQCAYFVDVASDYKCDFILFPEMLTTQLLSFIRAAHPSIAMRELSEFTPTYLDLFTQLAVKFNINIIGGSHFTMEDESLFNIAYLFRRDGTLEKQYKLHITPSEREWWGVKPGDTVEVFDTDRGKIAIQICYDIEFPELTRIAVAKGAQIIFVPFCTDERYAYLRVRYCAQARCVENQIYVAIAGSVGNLPFVDNLDIHYAQSGIFTPSDIPFTRDAIAAECSPNIETVIFQDLDLELLRTHKQSGSVLNWNDRRTDLYEVRYLRETVGAPAVQPAAIPASEPASASEPEPAPVAADETAT